MLDGLVTVKNGKQYLSPDAEITRYEAIKIMMLAYDMIDKTKISLAGVSVMGDVVDANNPYYQYIRKAEVLGFISGIPQTNGGYNFVGQKDITRAEFAKIISVPFTEQLFDLEDLVLQSPLYASIQVALEQSNTDDETFLNALFDELDELSDAQFIKQYKIQKDAFFEKLYEMLQK
ncbi:S-layer homology domain-containing protein [Patescibacteria group bacterium]|nr:S-layer homology domain-containing protein [Patescibacteria group bacterium]